MIKPNIGDTVLINIKGEEKKAKVYSKDGSAYNVNVFGAGNMYIGCNDIIRITRHKPKVFSNKNDAWRGEK